MQDDYIKNFKVAFGAFCVMFVLIIGLFVLTIIFRSQGFQHACESVQNNNVKLITYLQETENRSFKRIRVEEAEGKIPVSSKQEISASLDPLIHTLEPIDC